MRRKTCLLFIFILCIEQISCLGLKTNCYVEGTSSQAICTCGGEYKWGEHGGGRFGVDLFDQIIWSRGSENIQDLKTITYEGCNSNSIFTLDLDAKYPHVNLIEFKNSGPVNIYFRGSVDKGNLTILFKNIHGSGELHFGAGSVVLRGSLDYCVRPCGAEFPFEEDKRPVPPGLEKNTCNFCTANSFLNLKFKTVEHVMLHDLFIGEYEEGLSGGTVIKAEDVQTFRVEDGSMRQVQNAGIDAGGCWNGRNECSCSDVLGTENSSDSSIIGLPIVVAILVLITIAIVFGFVIRKALMNRGTAVPTIEMA